MNHICTTSIEQHRREQMRFAHSNTNSVQLMDQTSMYPCQYQSLSREMLHQCRNGGLGEMLIPRPIFSTSMAPKLPQKLAKRKLSAAAVSNGTESKLAQACLAPVLSHAAGDPDLNLQQTEEIPLPAAVDRVDAAEEEAAAVDDDAEEITERTRKLDRSKGLTLKCRYCGSINTEKQLNENKQLYDPHLKRHLPGSPDRKEPTGMAARSGRCIFCYAEFPKASGLASCDAEVGDQMYHGTLGLEANKVTLKLRKKCVDDPESSLRYRVLLRSVGLLTSIMGKVSDKASKTFNPIC